MSIFTSWLSQDIQTSHLKLCRRGQCLSLELYHSALVTLLVTSENIFSASHFIGAKTQSFQLITWLVLVNKIKRPNYITNNLNITCK